MLVSVVSVVGAFRTGKSFLLTLFLRYLRLRTAGMSYKDMVRNDKWLYADGEVIAEGNRNQCSGIEEFGSDFESKDLKESRGKDEGFAWRGGQDRMTTGIWMWSEPFLHYSEEAGQEVAILLMDTQGMFDNETTMNLTAQIFGISTLVSSFQIYNVQNSIGEDKMMHLALFSEYGRIALQPPDRGSDCNLSPSKEQGGAESESESGGDEDIVRENSKEHSGSLSMTETEEEDGEPFNFKAEVKTSQLKPFQNLLFLVRDWPNFDESLEETLQDGGSGGSGEEGLESAFLAEMQAYFKGVIGVRGQTDLQSTREQISRCFESVSAFFAPPSGYCSHKEKLQRLPIKP